MCFIQALFDASRKILLALDLLDFDESVGLTW